MKTMRITASALGLAVATVFSQTAQAQDVYNFYFQKAPGAAVTPAQTIAPQPQQSPSPAAPAAAPVAAPIAPPSTPTSVVAAPNPTATEEKPKFYNWSVQLLRADVADSFSDVHRGVRERLGLQVGYRLNKYVGAEIGTSFGSMYTSWKGATGREISDSFVPFIGARVNPFHLNIFGAEMLEFFVLGGAMYLDSSQTQGQYALNPTGEGKQQLYGYLGGGMRVCFGERVGLEIASHVQNGDSRYGFSSIGVDVRF